MANQKIERRVIPQKLRSNLGGRLLASNLHCHETRGETPLLAGEKVKEEEGGGLPPHLPVAPERHGITAIASTIENPL